MVFSNLEPSVSQRWVSPPPGRECLGNRGASETDAVGRRIARTVGYMRESLNQTVQVSKLARLANISPSHFFAVFKKLTGFAPLDFFIRLRMRRACELLESPALSVKEVAGELGYDDPFYFSRMFKSVNGIAPTGYRRLEQRRRRAISDAVLGLRNGCAVTFQAQQIEFERNS